MKKIKIFVWLVIIAIIYFFGKSLFVNYKTILSYDFSFNPRYLLISTILFIVTVIYGGFLWGRITLKFTGKKISIYQQIFIHSTSWIAKYVPGQAGSILTKVYFLQKNNVSKKTAIVISLYENIFGALTAFIVSIPIIFFIYFNQLNYIYKYGSIIFITVFTVFLHPRIFYTLINSFLRILKKEQLPKEFFLGIKDIVLFILFYGVRMIINGIALFFMIKGITIISYKYLIPVIGIWNFAGVIGLLAIFMPAGLGVREGLLILFLKSIFPLQIAVLISVFSRFWVTIVDGVIGLYILIIKIIIQKKV